MKVLLSYFKRHKALFAIDLTAALIVAVIDLLFPMVTRWSLYTLIPNSAWKTFWTVMALVFVFYIIRSLLTFVMWYWGHSFGVIVETDMRHDLFKHIQSLGFDFFDERRTGAILSRLTTDLFDITEMAHHAPEDIFVSTVTITGALIIMFSIEWHLALVIAIMLPISLFIVLKSRRNMSLASRKVKENTALINTEYESAISGFRTAKSFANEQLELQKFDKASNSYRFSKYAFYKAMGLFNSSIEFFLCSLTAIIIAVGGALIMNGKMSLVDLITFSLYITTFVGPVRRLAVSMELITSGTAGLRRFIEIMNVEPSITDKDKAITLENVKGDITLKDVSFSYKNKKDVIKDISLDIKSGEMVAIVGSSGGGKTTLASLIPRFYDVNKGSIYIDGNNVKDVSQKSLHENIGIISQDVFLFAGTVEDNIRYGRLDATEDEIIDAAKKAEIYDDILKMPKGLKTNVGERGVLLSGGQKQRIAIARIFLKNPPVLILDEATSALDSVTEYKIQKTFEKLSMHRTSIVIAHRLSTVKNANRIVVINDGTIQEIGTHDELLKANGVYKTLVDAQRLII